MPKGNPTPQTVASEKYQQKAGYMTKGFKLKRNLVKEFEKACKKRSITPTAAVREFMVGFIEDANADN